MATSHTAPRRRSSGLRMAIGLGALAEVVVYVLVVSWIGLGWTILATLATTVLGWALLARQGTKALGELRMRAEEHRAPGRALGDAGLVALGGLLMVLPGFLGDLLGLLCLLPVTRALPRALIARGLLRRLPDALRGPVYVRSTRTETVTGPDQPFRAGPATRGEHPVIEGEVAAERTDP
ncbi:FxsA family protein [Modestobacter sp. VKM Ac-2985]|uniref:FxsA family protein n=1 Tax=Modestobacter sp. VKM Ac-2985 TaxID=3004139 RepID=UPI0022AB67C3|nr:FxsA family protein [Modestobacter sp. VKM Ac-2985]MCZ2839024.1 FxsA family protein [Modestobacter sp. VKM Ac-2985]